MEKLKRMRGGFHLAMLKEFWLVSLVLLFVTMSRKSLIDIYIFFWWILIWYKAKIIIVDTKNEVK